MRTLTQTEFACDTHTVIWRTCERCGAPVPCVRLHRYEDVSEVPHIRSLIGGCCGLCGLRPIHDEGPQDKEGFV
jgi:hypothetical protein